MADARRAKGSRIVVTCDTSPLGAAALDAAAALARQLDSELAGLFVENINLLRMAQLPFAREYALSGARARRVEADELERSLRGQAEAVRNALSHAAHELSLPWSFQVVRGGLMECVLDALREADFAVFGHTGQYAMAPNARPMRAGPAARPLAPRRPILVIYDGIPGAERALAAANVLAHVHRTSVFVLLIAADAAVAQALRERAATQFESSVPVHFQSLKSRDAQGIRSAADAHNAAALLWYGAKSEADRKTLETLVDALKCPVVLVS